MASASAAAGGGAGGGEGGGPPRSHSRPLSMPMAIWPQALALVGVGGAAQALQKAPGFVVNSLGPHPVALPRNARPRR